MSRFPATSLPTWTNEKAPCCKIPKWICVERFNFYGFLVELFCQIVHICGLLDLILGFDVEFNGTNNLQW